MDIAAARNYPLLATPFLRLSLVQCAAACATSPFCSMFLYNLPLNKCALFGVSNGVTISYTYSGDVEWQAYVYKSDCRYLYVKALNSCWKIIESPASMTSARSACRTLGGDLVQVRSLEEFNFMKGSLSGTSAWSNQSYWIGASKTSNGFTWLDTNQVIDGGMWGDGQPDSFGSKAENCVNVWPGFGYSLNDMACGEPNPYICSLPVMQAYGK
ncbi:hypothetical protein BsWGS_28179 [Bradybaena similaris]